MQDHKGRGMEDCTREGEGPQRGGMEDCMGVVKNHMRRMEDCMWAQMDDCTGVGGGQGGVGRRTSREE